MSNIIDFQEPVKVNPYKADVEALIAAGEGKAGELIVPTDQASKARVTYAKAANDADKTARLRITEVDEKKGTTRFVFTLTSRHKARRGNAETSAVEDSPVE
jgi:hypothetical protein